MTAPTPAPRSPVGRYAAVWFCYFAAIGSFNPYAPLWYQELGLSALAIGGIASLQAWSRVLAPYGWAWLGDHGFGRVRLIRWGAAASVLCACGLLWARGHAVVALCVFMLFVANGAVVPLTEAALARHLNTDGVLDSERYARVRMWGSLGFICAVVLFGALLQAAGIGWFPALVVAMFGLLLVASVRLPITGNPAATAAAAATAGSALAVLRQRAVAWFFASIFFTVLAHTAVYAFFALYLHALGYDKTSIGLIWAVSVVAEIAFFRWQGKWFERWSPARWLQAAAALAVLRFACTAALGQWWPALVFASLLHAVTFAAQHVAIIVFINERFAGALRARGQALYTVIGYGASGVVGGVAGGWLITHWGHASVFWAAALMGAAGWWCGWRAERCSR